MKHLIPLIKVFTYILVVYVCLYVLISFAAYSNFKANEVRNIEVNEANSNWVSGGTFSYGAGVVNSIFGKVNIPFSLHCFRTAQSYFDLSISFTTTYINFFLVPASVILFTILKLKKLKIHLITVILLGVIVPIVFFGLFQIWLSTNTSFDDKGILKILHPICF